MAPSAELGVIPLKENTSTEDRDTFGGDYSVADSAFINRGRADSSQSIPDTEGRARTESVNSSDGGVPSTRPRRLLSLKEDSMRSPALISADILSVAITDGRNPPVSAISASSGTTQGSQAAVDITSASPNCLSSRHDAALRDESFAPEYTDSKVDKTGYDESSELSSEYLSSLDSSDSDFESSGSSSESSTDFPSLNKAIIDHDIATEASQNRKVLFLKKISPKT